MMLYVCLLISDCMCECVFNDTHSTSPHSSWLWHAVVYFGKSSSIFPTLKKEPWSAFFMRSPLKITVKDHKWWESKSYWYDAHCSFHLLPGLDHPCTLGSSVWRARLSSQSWPSEPNWRWRSLWWSCNLPWNSVLKHTGASHRWHSNQIRLKCEVNRILSQDDPPITLRRWLNYPRDCFFQLHYGYLQL